MEKGDIPLPVPSPYPGPPLNLNEAVHPPPMPMYPGPQPGPSSGPQPGPSSGPQPGPYVVPQYPQQPGPQPGPYGAPPYPQQPGPQHVPYEQKQSPQQQAVTANVVTVSQQVVVVQPQLGDVPGHAKCPYCHASVVTRTEYKTGLLTWLLCGIVFLLVWPCAFIPFFIDACKDVEHSCPECNRVLHIYKRM